MKREQADGLSQNVGHELDPEQDDGLTQNLERQLTGRSIESVGQAVGDTSPSLWTRQRAGPWCSQGIPGHEGAEFIGTRKLECRTGQRRGSTFAGVQGYRGQTNDQ